ncbi:MAG: glycosyltransferase family 25 protein [Chlamydiia bacterium]|nr:glycosyltransferase family 25 protein [Chlamydiia bacterium]
MFRFIIGLCLSVVWMLPSNVLGVIEDHFKKAGPKNGNHTMPKVDFIYMINLDQRPEKFERSREQLAKYGIYPFRFSAVNGWELTLDAINDVGVKYRKGMKSVESSCYLHEDKGEVRHEMMDVVGRTYFAHCLSRGAIGCCLSHLSVLQDAYDSGYKTIWVMEDDIFIQMNPYYVSECIKLLDKAVDKDWDVLFTDRDIKNNNGVYVPCKGYDKRRPNYQPKSKSQFRIRKNIDNHFRRIGARFGSHSMVIRRSGIKKILNFFKTYNIYCPYDIDYFVVPGIKMYTTRYDIVGNTPGSPSDNGGPRYNQEKGKDA